MDFKTKQRFRRLAKAQPWRKAGPAYKDAPHEYVWWQNSKLSDFRALKKIIQQHGTMGTWRQSRYRFLNVDGLVYWEMYSVVNRSLACSLDRGGYPGPAARVKIAKRFGRKD